MEDNSNKTYNRILKGAALFGGVQIFQILINLIRGKSTAVFIGAVGIGLSSMYITSLAMLITLVSMGCNLSSVKFISAYDRQSNDYYEKINHVQRIFAILAIIGALLTILLACPLSYLTFSSYEHVSDYLILSIYVASSIYSSGIYSILQGMQELKSIAVGNIIPSTLGLLLIIPLYYIWGILAVVPVIVVVPILSCFFSTYLLNEIYIRNGYKFVLVPCRKTIEMLKEFSSLGITMAIATLLGNIKIYAVNGIIKIVGKLADVGFYQAGTSITTQYIGLVFSAMGQEYFPRLAAVVDDTDDMNNTVNKQAEITILLAVPLLAVMMLTAPIVIRILLSEEFIIITDFICIIALAVCFQALAYPLGYISFAKGDKIFYFFFDAVWGNLVGVVLLGVGYYISGLVGLAYGQLINYCLYFVLIIFFTRERYGFRMNMEYRYFSVGGVASLVLLYFILLQRTDDSKTIAIIITTLICVWSTYLLEIRVRLISKAIKKLMQLSKLNGEKK